MTQTKYLQFLSDGCIKLNIQLAKSTQAKLIEFALLLAKWNKAYNLTSPCSIEEIINRHILDSLSILPYIEGDRILDVGTGAGFPGIPLALVLPQKNFTLIDSNHKKTKFLNYTKAMLKVSNIEIICGRVEEFNPEQKFDHIITRAFAALPDIIAQTKHLYTKDGSLLAMKGKVPVSELQKITGLVTIYELTFAKPFTRNLIKWSP